MEGNTSKARELIVPERLEKLAEEYGKEANAKERQADELREQELQLRAEVYALRSAVEVIQDARQSWETRSKENQEMVSDLPTHKGESMEQLPGTVSHARY